MARSLRALLLGSIAVAFLYLLVHAREPLRFNVGDPWSDANVLTAINYVKSDGFLATSFTDVLDVGPLTADSYRYTHYPPFAEIFYGAVGKFLGVSDIGTFRLFALAWSALAMWLLFSYVRRLYSDRIALIATALATTSLMWMMYADSIHQAPVMTATMFLALWGLVRAIETRQRRHYGAALVGSFLAFFTSYDCYIFLPAAVLVTVYLKRGNPLARGNRHFVALCAAGCALGIVAKCLAVIGAIGWNEFVADLRLQFVERSSSTYDRKFTSSIPTLVRRVTVVFTPLAWVAAAFHALKAIRAPDVSSAIKHTAAWMLLAAFAFVAVFPQLAASQMLPSQVFLPFYAVGSAIVVDRMLDGSTALRRLGYAWLVAAPLWSLAIFAMHPRAVLDRGDVSKATAYLTANDHNDFLLSNLTSIGHIQAAFDRHAWGTPDSSEPADATAAMMSVFEMTGTDQVHAVIASGPDSRFIDKCLWPLALERRMWAATGWPFFHRRKVNALIAEYDRRVVKNLEAVHATNVLQLGNFAIYRIDRAAMIAQLAESLAVTDHIDFGSPSSVRHLLIGWKEPQLVPGGDAAAVPMEGMFRCGAARGAPHGNACKSVLTNLGLEIKHVTKVPAAQLAVRVERACELRLAFGFATDSFVRFTINGFTVAPPPGRTAAFTVPAASVKQGLNIIELESRLPLGYGVYLASLDVRPACPP